LLAVLVGILVGFKAQGRFVFSNSDNTLLFRFAAGWAILYLVNTVLIGELVTLGLNPYSAGALALPLIAVLSFLMQSRLVFARRGNGETWLSGGGGE
jgi:hypothetical protein